MPFREKVKRVLRHSSSSSNNNNNSSSNNKSYNKKKRSQNSGPLALNSKGMKVEYYRRNEVPPSKFRGPFDRNFQRQLAAWNFQDATAERCRSPDLSLSPCTTLSPQDIKRTLHMTDQPSEEYIEEVAPARPLNDMNGSTNTSTDTSQKAQTRSNRRTDVTSIATTAVDPESLGSSLSTLLDDSHNNSNGNKNSSKTNNAYDPRGDSVSQLKSSNRTHVPPQTLPSKGTRLPFAPEDLSRALEAAHIRS